MKSGGLQWVGLKAMPTTLRQAINQIKSLVRDDADKLVADDGQVYLDCLTTALIEYSFYYPRQLVVDVTVNASGNVDLTDADNFPYGFDETFYESLTVEYPVGQITPAMLNRLMWQLYNTPSGRFLRLSSYASKAIRLNHRVPHSIPLNADTGNPDMDGLMTVRASDMPAVMWKAASEALQQLANSYAQQQEHGIVDADQALYQNKSRDYAQRSKEYADRFDEHIKRVRRNYSRPAQILRA